MPTLADNATPVAPIGATIYYRRRTKEKVKPFPAGLKMIAGDSKAQSAQSLRITFWNCGPNAGIAGSNAKTWETDPAAMSQRTSSVAGLTIGNGCPSPATHWPSINCEVIQRSLPCVAFSKDDEAPMMSFRLVLLRMRKRRA